MMLLRSICLGLLLTVSGSFVPLQNVPLKVCTWNLKDFGRSKSAAEITFMANLLKGYDVVAVQEVVAGSGGPQAVARLGEALNRTGAAWHYSVSAPTYGSSYKRERYAFLWKTSRVKPVGQPWLEQTYRVAIDREPYYATFQYGARAFTLVNFHAVTRSKQPEREVKYFRLLPAQYPGLNLVFCGDFNLPQSHSVFNPLKSMGYIPALRGQKTSLREKCKGDDCLASEFDNLFYPKASMRPVSAGIIPFYASFPSLKEARLVSDHVPVYFEFGWN